MSSGQKRKVALPAAAAGLRVKTDDFSVQVEAPDDATFWARALPSNSDEVVVTDLKRSDLSTERVAAAVELAVERATLAPNVSRLRFLDIAPSRREPLASEQRARQEAAQITKAMVLFALARSLRIEDVTLERDRGKFHLDMTFQPE